MLIPVLIGVSIIVFVIMRVFSPDPAPIVLGQHATVAAAEAWREANGLNQPLYIQYFHFITGVFIGDLGNSYYTKTPVIKEIFARFPATDRTRNLVDHLCLFFRHFDWRGIGCEEKFDI